MTNMQVYNVSLIGDGGVGKTAWIKKLITSLFEQKYVPTLGVEVDSFVMGQVKFNIWDCAGQEKLGGLRDSYYNHSDFCIAMFDFSNKHSIKNLLNWIRDFKRVYPYKKIIVVGNKKELASDKTILLANQLQRSYIEMSVKEGFNTLTPFVYLLQ